MRGVARIAGLVSLCCACHREDVAGTGTALGSIISRVSESAFEAETNLAIAGDGRAAAVWMSFQPACTPSIGYAFSTDLGQSWAMPRLIDAPDGRRSEEPSVAADSVGNLYLAWLGTAGGADAHIFFSRALAGRTIFSVPPVDLSGGGVSADVDFPRVVVDPAERVYVTWLDRKNNVILSARSMDQGEGFETSVVFAQSDLGQLAGLVQPCTDVAGSGRIYATFVHRNPTKPESIFLRNTDEAGTTWSAPGPDPVANDAIREPPTCAVLGQDVWVSYARGNETGEALPLASSLWVRHSSDGGATWDLPVAVEAGGFGTLFFLPKLAVTARGMLVMDYYEGPLAGAATLVRAESPDGVTWTRTSWTPTGTLVSASSPCGDHRWLGDSIGLVATDRAIFAVAADNSSGASHVRFVRK